MVVCAPFRGAPCVVGEETLDALRENVNE